MKNHLTIKDWVCLLDEASLEARLCAHRAHAQRSNCMPGPMTECLWRQIEVSASADQVHLTLMNVDGEAAAGGYCRGGECPRKLSFTWDDLHDVEFIDNMLAREQVVVYRRIVTMLAVLKARCAVLREALTAF